MTDQLAKPNGMAINDRATIAELKAKKQRQQPRVDDATPGIATADTATASAPVQKRGSGKASAKQPRPDRAGKKLIAGYFPPEIQKALKHMGIDEGLTLQQVMAEAFALYLATKERPPKP